MAKLTDLPKVTSLEDDDLIYAVDISDPTDDPAGSSVAITKANLVGGGGGGETKTRSVRTEIANIDLTAGSEYLFPTIAQDFDRLIIKGSLVTDRAGNDDFLRIEFNGAAVGADYHAQSIQGYDGGVQVSELAGDAVVAALSAASSGADNGIVRIEVENYTAAKDHYAEGYSSAVQAAGGLYTGGRTVVWAPAAKAAVTQIRLYSYYGSNMTGKLTLYGEKTEEIGAGGGGTGTVVKEAIAFISDPGTGEFDFDTIPQTYTHVWLEGLITSSRSSSTIDEIYILFNADETVANYFHTRFHATNSSTGVAEGSTPQVASQASSTSTAPGIMRIDVPYYSSATVLKHANSRGSVYRSAGAELRMDWGSMFHDSMVAPITRIRIRSEQFPTDTLSGTLTLYGERTL